MSAPKFALFIHDPAVPALPTHKTYFSGQPSMKRGALWPVCRSCEGNMQFLGQVQIAAQQHIALFMCQNDPGLCDEWDADAGGNAAVQVGADDLSVIGAPDSGEVYRGQPHSAQPVLFTDGDYDQARDQWLTQSGGEPRAILGMLGGAPSWLQADETPTCDHCSQPMDFVAQLEEGPDHETAMNFGGGGCAYVFRCECEAKAAKLLWQC